MIIDCHAHVFEHWIGPCGHATRDLHAKYLQWTMTRTVARAFRLRDGAPADTRALYQATGSSWAGMREVNFRVGRFGRLEFSVDGEDYAVQYMPVGMQELVAPPELMLAQMMNAGVDHCVLQAGGGYGAMNDYNAYAQHQYPRRMTGLMHVDEAMAATPENLREIDRARDVLGLRGIYYNVSGFGRHGFPWGLDDSRLEPLWDKLAAKGISLCIELTSGPTFDAAGYMRHLTALGRVLTRYPALRCHIAMGPPVQYFAKDGRWEFPDEALAVYRRDEVVIEVMFPITWGGLWDYPYPEAQSLIKGMRDELGAERLMWGSDMPNVERFCTYRQSLDYVRRYCGFLSAREKDLILGETCARFYGLNGGTAWTGQ